MPFFLFLSVLVGGTKTPKKVKGLYWGTQSIREKSRSSSREVRISWYHLSFLSVLVDETPPPKPEEGTGGLVNSDPRRQQRGMAAAILAEGYRQRSKRPRKTNTKAAMDLFGSGSKPVPEP